MRLAAFFLITFYFLGLFVCDDPTNQNSTNRSVTTANVAANLTGNTNTSANTNVAAPHTATNTGNASISNRAAVTEDRTRGNTAPPDAGNITAEGTPRR
jgi:hypothetical protein